MANFPIPSGGQGTAGQLTVTVNSAPAVAGINVIQARLIAMGNSVQSVSNKMSSSWSKIKGMITKVASSLAGLFAIKAISEAFKGFISRLVEVNRLFVGFIASMSIVRGSVAAANKEYEFLLSLSNKLGVQIETSITQYHRLAASLKNVDRSGELARHIFAGISQAAVVLQSSGRDVTLIFEAVQQMASKGKLSLEELQRQLGNTLPGAFSTAARGMMASQRYIDAGIKTASQAEKKLREDIQKGTINVYEFLAYLTNQIKKDYGSGVEYASKQFIASFNRMKNMVMDFYNTVGNSGAIQGLQTIVDEIFALFSDRSLGKGVGESLGDMFRSLAVWIGKLDSSDITEFFDAVKVSISTTTILASELINTLAKMGTDAVKTPILSFAEVVGKSMAIVTDAVNGVILTFQFFINGLRNMWLQIKDMADPDEILLPFYNAIDRVGNRMGVEFAGKDSRDKYRDRVATRKSDQYENNLSFNRIAGDIDNLSSGNGAYSRVSSAFDDLYEQRRITQGVQTGTKALGTFGVQLPEYGKGPIDPGSFSNKFDATTFDPYATTNLPDFLKRSKTPADDYTRVLTPEEMRRQIEEIQANSGAPTGPKPAKGGGGSKSENAYLKETTRLLKGVATANNEYTNVLENRNRKEGEHEAQMRVLIQSDERFMKLSSDQKASLMANAQAWDAAIRKVQDAIKVQDSYNEALQSGFDAQDRMAELRATGYESQYRALSTLLNSFKEGGENEFMDVESRRKMIASETKKDMDQRNLDMGRFLYQNKQVNEEMRFQADLFGKSTLEQQKLTEFRKIDLWIAMKSAGATGATLEAYKQLAIVLKEDVASALDYVAQKQKDALGGVMASIQAYMDEVKNRSSEWSQVTTNGLHSMEDALVSFTETGKLSFKDLASSMAKDLARLIVRYQMLMLLQMITGMLSKTSVPDNGSAAFGSYTMGGETAFGAGSFGGGFAKGGAFTTSGQAKAFAKGGAFTNGIFDQPTIFRYGRGGSFGEMGEKGPEAVMPLVRDSTGSLGVKAIGSGSGEAVLNLQIEVYQGEGSGVKTEKSQTKEGDILKVFIGEVAADVQRGGPVAKAITQVYGIGRKPRSYT